MRNSTTAIPSVCFKPINSPLKYTVSACQVATEPGKVNAFNTIHLDFFIDIMQSTVSKVFASLWKHLAYGALFHMIPKLDQLTSLTIAYWVERPVWKPKCFEN